MMRPMLENEAVRPAPVFVPLFVLLTGTLPSRT
jgi:hypothetical protein